MRTTIDQITADIEKLKLKQSEILSHPTNDPSVYYFQYLLSMFRTATATRRTNGVDKDERQEGEKSAKK